MPMLTATQTWISTKQAAEIIGVAVDHVGYLCRHEKLKAQQISGVWLVEKASAEEYAATEQATGRPRGS